MNDKSFILTQENPEEPADNELVPHDISHSKEMKLYRGIISKPGKIISFSVLNEKGFFRRTGPDAIKGKLLMQQTADEMAELQIGIIEKITISGNKSQVRYNIFKHQKQETLILQAKKQLSNTILPYKVNYIHTYDI